jgi:lysophospholipase L1-like esterase
VRRLAFLAGSLWATALLLAPEGSASRAKKDVSKRPAVPVVAEVEGRSALDPYFQRFQDGKSIRVSHFGDSHVAADYWTGELRRLLQERLGDGGPGYVMPGSPWIYFRHARARSFSTGGWETVGLGRDPQDGLYGRSGTALSPTGADGTAGVEAVFSSYRVELLTLSGGACLAVVVDGVTHFAGLLDPPDPGDQEEACCRLTYSPAGDAPIRLVTVENAAPLENAFHRLEIRDACGGVTRILGVDLTSGPGGAVVDTLGLNGAELSLLGKWQAPLRTALLQSSAPSLVIVSFGTNDMGRSDFEFESYRTRAIELLQGLRRDLPGGAVLVTGPIDRGAKRQKGAGLIARNAPLVTRALRDAALSSGCAFWDARAAMGGDGAIRKWQKNGLAQRDQVHLTGTGYVRLAGLLFESLMRAMEEWRKSR